jgi:hypothetical protein
VISIKIPLNPRSTPNWLPTDMGGKQAPNAVESVLPGALVPALLDDETTGQLFRAQDYVGKRI